MKLFICQAFRSSIVVTVLSQGFLGIVRVTFFFLVLLLKILITLFLLFIARQNECEEKKNLDPLCSKTSFEGKIRIFSEHFRKIQKSCGNDKIKRQGRVIA